MINNNATAVRVEALVGSDLVFHFGIVAEQDRTSYTPVPIDATMDDYDIATKQEKLDIINHGSFPEPSDKPRFGLEKVVKLKISFE